jgi:hypothetical protein
VGGLAGRLELDRPSGGLPGVLGDQQAEGGQVLFNRSSGVMAGVDMGRAVVRDGGLAPAARQRSMQRSRHGRGRVARAKG